MTRCLNQSINYPTPYSVRARERVYELKTAAAPPVSCVARLVCSQTRLPQRRPSLPSPVPSVARLFRRPSLPSPVSSVDRRVSVCFRLVRLPSRVIGLSESLGFCLCVCVCRGSGGGGRPHRQVCQRAPPPHAPKGPRQRPRASHHALQGVGCVRCLRGVGARLTMRCKVSAGRAGRVWCLRRR